MSEFLGEDRAALRDTILDRVDTARASTGPEAPRIILLEGLSGVGKSRVIREVYETLRQTRVGQHPQYWPTLRTLDREPTEALQSATVGARKILGPRVRGFVWENDALPTFLWWSINCEQLSNGDYDEASAQLDEALRWHSAAILLGWRELATVSQQAKEEIRRTVRGIREVLFGDAWDSATSASEVMEALAGLDLVISSVPGLGMVVKSLKGLFGRLADERRLSVSLAQQVTYGESAEDRAQAASSLAARLRGMALSSMPVIVAVEDAHRMSVDLGRLLDRLAEPDERHPIVVLCTAWPMNDPASPYEDWKKRAIREDRIEVHRVGDLDEGSRRAIIDAVVPGTDGQVKDALVAKWRNPLCLELFLSWDEVQERIMVTANGPALRMTVGQIHVAPSSIADLYQARWSALRPSVKKVLLTAAGCLPVDQPMHAFAAETIAEVVTRNPMLVTWAVDGAHDEFLTLMSDARAAHWTLDLGIAETFREIDLAEVVARDAQRSFAYQDLQQAIAEVLAVRIDGLREGGYVIDLTQPDTALVARWITALAPADDDAQLAVAVARLALARTEAQAWQFERALGLVGTDDVLRPMSPEHPHTLAARLDIATWVGEAGDVESGRARCEALVDDCIGLIGTDDPITLIARRWLAHYTGLCGSKSEARSMFLALVSDCERLEDVTAIELNARSNAALWTGEVEEFSAAVDELTRLIPQCSRFFGEDHHETLESRRLRARFAGEGGDPTGAREQYEVLVDDCLRMFTPTHFESLECRRGLGRWTSEAGDPEAAVPMYRAVADDCARIYGPTHFLTLWAWIGLGDALANVGQKDEALTWALKAHNEAVTTWSPSHRLVTTSAERGRRWRESTD
ncbi:MAG: ATP-binding protein [Candidatus Nanopelagicales bacterium]|nr:ATP-binding protein [Candidatus Nanopelagicales bacterium]